MPQYPLKESLAQRHFELKLPSPLLDGEIVCTATSKIVRMAIRQCGSVAAGVLAILNDLGGRFVAADLFVRKIVDPSDFYRQYDARFCSARRKIAIPFLPSQEMSILPSPIVASVNGRNAAARARSFMLVACPWNCNVNRKMLWILCTENLSIHIHFG